MLAYTCMGMSNDNAFLPLMRVPHVRLRLSVVRRHLINALCAAAHLLTEKLLGKSLERSKSLFA